MRNKGLKDFAVFILTNGRPDRVVTYDTLKRCGYTGPIYLIVDDLDDLFDRELQNIFNRLRFDAEDCKTNFYETNSGITITTGAPMRIDAQPGGGWSNSTGTTVIVGAHPN